MRIAADEHLKPVILDNDGDLTFNSAEYVQGLFIKKGTGTLKFDLPAGTFAIGVNSADENIGENAGQIEFPETGDSPTSTSGLLGINILEGTMKVVGVSSSQTRLYAQNTATIGGGYRGEVPAVLEVEKASVYWGGSSRHGFMCRYLPENTPAPELHLNDAYFWTDSIHLGSRSYGSDTTVKVTMTNSTFWGQYNANVGSDTVAVKIDANNSKLHSNADLGWTIQAKRLDADFYGQDALFASQSKSGSGNAPGRFWFYDQVTGLIKVRNGATLQTTRGVRMNGSTVDVVFDGGKFSILAHNTELETQSMWNANKGSGFNSIGAGLELQIPDTCIHSFNFPIYGGGSVTKTGAGTFKLVAPRKAGEKLLQYTGGTIVSNGTFVIDGSLVADDSKAFTVASGAVLDLNGTPLSGATLSGAGTVTNGTLSAATIPYNATTGALTFSDVAFDGVLTVDFGCTAENPLDIEGARAGFVVAKYTGDMPAGLVVRPVNTGLVRPHARVSFADGNISVSVVNLGLSVFLR